MAKYAIRLYGLKIEIIIIIHNKAIIMAATSDQAKIDPAYTCDVCMDLLFKPQISVNCGHTFCIFHIGLLLNKPCPICREVIKRFNENYKLTQVISTAYAERYTQLDKEYFKTQPEGKLQAVKDRYPDFEYRAIGYAIQTPMSILKLVELIELANDTFSVEKTKKIFMDEYKSLVSCSVLKQTFLSFNDILGFNNDACSLRPLFVKLNGDIWIFMFDTKSAKTVKPINKESQEAKLSVSFDIPKK